MRAFFLTIRRPPRSTRTATLFTYPTPFRSSDAISRRHSTAPPGPASSPGIAHLSLLHIAILAIVQGITEFLPISSSAHLILTWQAFDAIGMVGIEQSEHDRLRSEEHTSELQSLMRISYAVFCLKKKKIKHI